VVRLLTLLVETEIIYLWHSLALTGKLGGMNENVATFILPGVNASPQALVTRVYETANILLVPSSTPDRLHLFGARSVAADTDVLVEIKIHEGQATVKVNCDKIVIGSMLLKDLKAALTRV